MQGNRVITLWHIPAACMSVGAARHLATFCTVADARHTQSFPSCLLFCSLSQSQSCQSVCWVVFSHLTALLLCYQLSLWLPFWPFCLTAACLHRLSAPHFLPDSVAATPLLSHGSLRLSPPALTLHLSATGDCFSLPLVLCVGFIFLNLTCICVWSKCRCSAVWGM